MHPQTVPGHGRETERHWGNTHKKDNVHNLMRKMGYNERSKHLSK